MSKEVRLIDANTVVTVQAFDEMYEEYSLETLTVAKALDRWTEEGCPPTVDAAPVVRCKNCMFSKKFMTGNLYCELHESYAYTVHPDGFCSRGAKMDGGTKK